MNNQARDLSVHVDDLRLPSEMRRLLAELIVLLGARGVEAYATGGFIRDVLLRREVHDLDITMGANPVDLAPQLADLFGGDYFTIDREKPLVRVLIPDHDLHFDFAPLAGSLENDLLLRDYTVDAMAAPLEEVPAGSVHLTDPTGGYEDLGNRTIRVVAESALVNDPLRLLRAARLAVQLDFEIEPETRDAIKRNSARLAEAAPERQRDELIQVLRTDRGAGGLRLSDDLDLLDRLLPEATAMRGVEQPKEHYWDVFQHSMATVEALDWLLADKDPETEPNASLARELWGQLEWWPDARTFFAQEYVSNTHRCSLVKLAGFMHDIGKPDTKSVEKSGRTRFYGHAAAGAAIASRALRRLRFSSREVEFVHAMIDAHMRPLQLWQQGEPTRKAVYRFFRDTGDAGVDTLFLSLADHLATSGPQVTLDEWRPHVSVVNYMLQKRFLDRKVVAPEKLIGGEDLMGALEIEPGPLLGELLEEVREAQAAGEVATREEAITLARRRLEGSTSAP
jgi:poly(A) polymerase